MKKALGFIRNIFLIGTLSGALVYLLLNGPEFDLRGAIISFVCGTIYSAVMTSAQTGAVYMAERFIPMRSRRDILVRVMIHGLAIALSFLLATWLLRMMYDLAFLYNRMALVIIGLVALSGSVISNGVYYLELFHQRMRVAESAALRAQLAALRAQINPHFLFNSLNSIAALTRIDPARAETLTESLADLFRYSLRSSQQPEVALAEEIESVELYLAIERARFGERLAVTVSVPPRLARSRMPSLTLQPLVENAVKHGMGAMQGVCTVSVIAAVAGGDMVVRVTDNGPGFATTDLDALVAMGSGLGNVRDRLAHHVGGSASMTILPNGVELRFPQTASHAAGTLPEGDARP